MRSLIIFSLRSSVVFTSWKQPISRWGHPKRCIIDRVSVGNTDAISAKYDKTLMASTLHSIAVAFARRRRSDDNRRLCRRRRRISLSRRSRDGIMSYGRKTKFAESTKFYGNVKIKVDVFKFTFIFRRDRARLSIVWDFIKSEGYIQGSTVCLNNIVRFDKFVNKLQKHKL